MTMAPLLEQHGSGSAILTLNRPEALNAPTPQMLDALSCPDEGLGYESRADYVIKDTGARIESFRHG